jgi:hypothetical protein
MSLRNPIPQNKDVKRTKIELKEDHSVESKGQSSIFDKTTLDTQKDTLINPDTLKKIYTFNKYIGDAISGILQFQYEFSKILSELSNEFGNQKANDKLGKDKEKILNSGILNDPSSPHETLQHDKSLLPSFFKLEKLEKDLQSLISFNKTDKDSNKSSLVKSSVTSPPTSARTWDPSKRSSVPHVLSDTKKIMPKKELSPTKPIPIMTKSPEKKTQNTASSNSNPLIKSTQNPKGNVPLIQPPKTKVTVPKLSEAGGLSLLRKSQSPQRIKDFPASNPSSHRDVNGKAKKIEYMAKTQRNVLFSSFNSFRREIHSSRERSEVPKEERRPTKADVVVTEVTDRDRYERKLSIKPYLDVLRKKELHEDSFIFEHTVDKNQNNSQETSRANHDETIKTVDMDDRQGQGQNCGTGNPAKEKEVIKALIKEITNYTSTDLPKGNS